MDKIFIKGSNIKKCPSLPNKLGFYAVEQIVGFRVYKGVVEFKVKWMNWNNRHNSWTPYYNIQNCEDLIRDYEESQKNENHNIETNVKTTMPTHGCYGVEQIVNQRVEKFVTYYELKWFNYPSSYNSWIPSYNLINCEDKVRDFEKASHLNRKDDFESTMERKACANENDEIFTVEKILGKKYYKGKPFFLVKWKGFPAIFNTEEPIESFIDPGIIKEYEDLIKQKRQKHFLNNLKQKKEKTMTIETKEKLKRKLMLQPDEGLEKRCRNNE